MLEDMSTGCAWPGTCLSWSRAQQGTSAKSSLFSRIRPNASTVYRSRLLKPFPYAPFAQRRVNPFTASFGAKAISWGTCCCLSVTIKRRPFPVNSLVKTRTLALSLMQRRRAERMLKKLRHFASKPLLSRRCEMHCARKIARMPPSSCSPRYVCKIWKSGLLTRNLGRSSTLISGTC